MLAFAASAQAARPNIDVGCSKPVSAKQGLAHAVAVWPAERWKRGAPKSAAIAAHRRNVRCARGPGHRAAIKRSWEVQRSRFYERRRYCRSGDVIEGRVSWFNGPSSSTASGTPVSTPGLALNIAPGTEAGWLNPTTLGWMDMARAGDPQIGLTTIAGRRAYLPIIDLGPHQITYRAIDVTEAGVYELGLSPGSFPTDSIGTVRLIPAGCR